MRLKEFFTAIKSLYNDGVANAIKVIPYEHHEIHDENAYLAIYSALKDNTGFIEVRFRPLHTSKHAHMTIHIDAALAATVEMWEATTKKHVVANAITPLNRFFPSSNQSILSVCHTPSGTQSGAATLGPQYIGSAAANGKSDVGGGSTSRSEFILTPWEDYLIKVTSRANSNALTIVLDWYEHEHS